MKISEQARKTYTERFWELRDDRRFHFATRIKNHFGVSDFDDFFEKYFSNTELAELLRNNDYSEVNFYEQRRGYFEKYNNLFPIEASLCRITHLRNVLDLDLRQELLAKHSEEELYRLCDALLEDKPALNSLSTYAVDTICLCENLFPRSIDVVSKLCKHIEHVDSPAAIYLITHIIICDTNFYARKIGEQHQESFNALLAQCEKHISDNFDEISLDIKLEFLVCSKMTSFETSLIDKIREECALNMSGGYLQDPRRDERLNTLNGAEHRNSLLVMSEI